MAQLRSIAQLGNTLEGTSDILRKTAQVIDADRVKAYNPLMLDMLKTLEDSGGVGLAAPQVHESVRMIIVASRPTVRYPHAPTMPATVMLNPEYTVLSDTLVKDWEGCLSISGIRALVPRYQSIGITYTDQMGDVQQLEIQDFVARIFQHEVDHLDGLVYLDRVEDNRDIVSETEYFKWFA